MTEQPRQPRITPAGIERAQAHLHPAVRDTPVARHDALDDWLGTRVACKVETLGPVRSFKGRGADWFLRASGLRTPVICASAGNFGQALAWAAARRGASCTVYAAVSANALKVARMRALGATVVLHGPDFDAAKAEARRVAMATGTTFVEDGREAAISEGAGTIGLELLRAGPFDTLLVPLGNGALLAGVATWARAVAPSTRVVGVVAAGAPAMQRALAGITVDPDAPVHTIADGIAVRVPVPEAVDDLRGLVDDVVAVDEPALRAAMRGLLAHLGLVVEPAGAAGVAALVAAPHGTYGGRVGTILCGSNVTPAMLADWGVLTPGLGGDA